MPVCDTLIADSTINGYYVFRITELSNNTEHILNCNACQDSYHLDCLESQYEQIFYTNIIWFCPLCAPTYQRVPIKFRKDGLKVPAHHEPLLIELNTFLKQHPFLECDSEPIFHRPLLSMKKIAIKNEKRIGGKAGMR